MGGSSANRNVVPFRPVRHATSITRRSFVTLSTTALITSGLRAQTPAPTTRPNVAVIDHDLILAAGRDAFTKPPNPLPPILGSPGTRNDFYSTPTIQTHSDALLDLTLIVPALTAAALILRDTQPGLAAQYEKHAAAHLDAWFVTPATRMTPAIPYAALLPTSKDPNPEGIVETIGLAEVAVALPFLTIDTSPWKSWFATYLQWLNENRAALLARDRKDHHASSWLLQTSAYARLTVNDATLADLRHRFKSVTIRAQIDANGLFPHELPQPNPYRNSLFNLDLLTGAAVLLSTRFESIWDYELQDGPGLRAAIAKFAPFIESRNSWPYPSDLDHFHDLPCRRPALLFAARAYSRAPYVELWRSLTPAQPTAPELLRTFPIRQPLLWTTQPRFIEPEHREDHIK